MARFIKIIKLLSIAAAVFLLGGFWREEIAYNPHNPADSLSDIFPSALADAPTSQQQNLECCENGGCC